MIGSRSAERAEPRPPQTLAEATGGNVTGADNAGAAPAGDIVVVAVPWDGHGDLLKGLATALAGKVVVDCVNPLGFDKQGAFALARRGGLRGPAGGRAAARLDRHRRLPQRLSAVKLEDPDVAEVDTDVLVLGEGETARPATSSRTSRASSPASEGVYGGRLRNAHQVEALTANLISVNRRYKAHAGIRVTDI